MTIPLFIGCVTFVFGPLMALFITVVSKRSQNVILAMGSAFLWTVSILLSSSLWMVVVPLRNTLIFIIPFSVALQEVSRFGIWKLYFMAYTKLEILRDDTSKPTYFEAAFSTGWGIAATMALVMQSSLLFAATGPGDLTTQTCPSVSVFHIEAMMTLAMALIHIALSIILFDAYLKKSWFLITLGVVMHFAASFAVRAILSSRAGNFRPSEFFISDALLMHYFPTQTILNSKISCIAGVSVIWTVLLLTLVTVWRLMVSPQSSLTRRVL